MRPSEQRARANTCCANPPSLFATERATEYSPVTDVALEPGGVFMKRLAAIVFVVGALLLFASPVAQAGPCLIVTITGAQGGPQAFQGRAGPGTLVRFGDD